MYFCTKLCTDSAYEGVVKQCNDLLPEGSEGTGKSEKTANKCYGSFVLTESSDSCRTYTGAGDNNFLSECFIKYY